MSPSSARARDPPYRETQERFWKLRIVTEVRSDGVYVRFDPVQRSFRRIPFDEIDEVAAATYSAAEYGGWHWGVRWSLTGDSAVYRLRGDDGVELLLESGERIFVGSRRPAELEAAIRTARDEP